MPTNNEPKHRATNNRETLGVPWYAPAAAAQPMTAKQFQQLTGLKKTSELFRPAFRDTSNVYAGVEKSQNAAPTAQPSHSPQEPATLAPPEFYTERPSTNIAQQTGSQGPTAGQPPLAALAALVPTAALTNTDTKQSFAYRNMDLIAAMRSAEREIIEVANSP